MKYADYIERKRHGKPDFPIQYYDVDERHPQYIMVPHWHKEWEFIRVLEGEFPINLGGVEYRLGQGEVWAVAPGRLHGGEPKNCHYECIVLDLNMLKRGRKDALDRYLSPLMGGQVALVRAQLDGEVASVCHQLFGIMKQAPPRYELLVYSLLFGLFSQMYEQGFIGQGESVARDTQAQTVMTLLDWIEDNYTESITLAGLSDRVGLSRKYLCRIFKEYTGKTVVDYINELRIDNACHEMTVKDMSVTRAAYDSGFNDLSYFCKVFKHYKGVTPRAYKKMEP